MSNQPKITYRSDTTCCTYQMMQHGVYRQFTIQAVNLDGVIVHESPPYAYTFPWRRTIDRFFDVINTHINQGIWVGSRP